MTLYSHSPRRAAVAVAVAAVAVLVGAPTAATAASSAAPWYVDVLKLDAAHADGFTGEGVTIAVIDGQINTAVPALEGADVVVREPSFCLSDSGEEVPAETTELSPTKPTDHGTSVVSMIVGTGAGYTADDGLVGIAPDAKILYYSTYVSVADDQNLECSDEDGNFASSAGAALNEAIDAGADIVSVSQSLGPSDEFVTALARAFREGVVVVGSLSNSIGTQLAGTMPAGANGAVGVQAAGADGAVQSTNGEAHYDASTDVVAPGLGLVVQGDPLTGQWTDQATVNGTSLATPLVAGALALVKQKYPDATGNQLLQSLIRNTSGEPDHEPAFDDELYYGYGLISVANLLSVDPTKYEDVNPLILQVGGPNDLLIPTYEQIFSETAAPSDDVTPAPEADESDGFPFGLLIGIGVAVIVVVGIAVLLLVILLRRKRTPNTN
jgi:subtilisin family serine protease